MVQFDNQYRQIKVKVVYYGPALGGKTTCLQHVHRVTDPHQRTKLYSLNTASDRTLFFDLLSLNLGRIRGYRLSMQLYTVPGQVQYNATRRAVLSGADGIVFVADSDPGQRQANRESLENLWENLAANGLDREATPLVLLYNKRDLPAALAVDDLEADLNPGGVPAFPSVAIRGDGVIRGFAAIIQRTLAAVADKLGVGASPQAVERLQEQARLALQSLLPEETGDPAAVADDVAVILPAVGDLAERPLDHEALVGEAVRANMAMTDLNARLDTLGRQLERKVEVLQGIGDFASLAARERDPQAVWRLVLDAAQPLLRLQGAAVVEVPSSGGIREAALHGFGRDPLLAAADETGQPLALRLFELEGPMLLERRESSGSDPFVDAVEGAGFTSALVVPMATLDRVQGLLVGYRDVRHRPLDGDDLQLASILAAHAVVAHANARSWRELENLGRDLERQVEERTAELRSSLAEVERLNLELRSSRDRLERAYQELAVLDRVRGTVLERVSTSMKDPVASLATATKLLVAEESTGGRPVGRYAAIIRDQVARIADIVHSVHQASLLGRPEADDLVLQSVEVQPLLRRVVAPLRELLQARGIRLHVRVATDLERLRCDPEQLEGALRSLLRNAVDYNQPNGEVSLEVRRVPRDGSFGVRFQLADTGVGISAEELEHVFDPFWRGRVAAADYREGLGLGLPVARRVVEKHGGQLTITSAPGDGTRVVVDLPQDG